jgi:predicted RNA-binding Zn-ribbon protein involved in translation (DUF1610 family)
MSTMTYIDTLVVTSCPTCGSGHAIPSALDRRARRHGTTVYCPLGHGWHYSKSIEQELAEARNDAKFYKDAMVTARRERDAVERSRSAYKGELTKVRTTIHAGKCPWCNRKYRRLAAHMADKHPSVDVDAEPPSPT